MRGCSSDKWRSIGLPLTATVVYVALLVWGSLASASDVHKLGFSFHDKGLHFVAYLVLAVIAFYLFLAISTILPVRINPIFASLLFASVVGIALEYCQSAFTRDRLFEYTDVVANILGAAVGLFLIRPAISNITSSLTKRNQNNSD